MKAVRILLVDRLPALRGDARRTPRPRARSLRCSRSPRTTAGAVALLRAWSPAVVVLDVALGTESGLPAQSMTSRSRHPELPRRRADRAPRIRDLAVEAVRRGVTRVASQDGRRRSPGRASSGASCRGESWIPPGPSLVRAPTGSPPPTRFGLPVRSTRSPARERVVLQCAVDGLSKPEIARRLFLSPNTVRTHTQNLLGKLPAHSMLEAVSLARRYGMRPTRSVTPHRVDLCGGNPTVDAFPA